MDTKYDALAALFMRLMHCDGVMRTLAEVNWVIKIRAGYEAVEAMRGGEFKRDRQGVLKGEGPGRGLGQTL